MEAITTRRDLGKWCTYQDSIRSDKATELGIDNTPSDKQYARMLLTYKMIYGPLCDHYGVKLPITSFFRSERLNRAISGASAKSAHMSGGAVDINCRRFSNPLTNVQLFTYIRTSGMVFDQLIFEAPDANGNPQWVHVSYSPDKNRQMVMRMTRDKNGQPVYEHWPWT